MPHFGRRGTDTRVRGSHAGHGSHPNSLTWRRIILRRKPSNLLHVPNPLCDHGERGFQGFARPDQGSLQGSVESVPNNPRVLGDTHRRTAASLHRNFRCMQRMRSLLDCRQVHRRHAIFRPPVLRPVPRDSCRRVWRLQKPLGSGSHRIAFVFSVERLGLPNVRHRKRRRVPPFLRRASSACDGHTHPDTPQLPCAPCTGDRHARPWEIPDAGILRMVPTFDFLRRRSSA